VVTRCRLGRVPPALTQPLQRTSSSGRAAYQKRCPVVMLLVLPQAVQRALRAAAMRVVRPRWLCNHLLLWPLGRLLPSRQRCRQGVGWLGLGATSSSANHHSSSISSRGAGRNRQQPLTADAARQLLLWGQAVSQPPPSGLSLSAAEGLGAPRMPLLQQQQQQEGATRTCRSCPHSSNSSSSTRWRGVAAVWTLGGCHRPLLHPHPLRHRLTLGGPLSLVPHPPSSSSSSSRAGVGLLVASEVWCSHLAASAAADKMESPPTPPAAAALLVAQVVCRCLRACLRRQLLLCCLWALTAPYSLAHQQQHQVALGWGWRGQEAVALPARAASR
jgi:hypothetical protein